MLLHYIVRKTDAFISTHTVSEVDQFLTYSYAHDTVQMICKLVKS